MASPNTSIRFPFAIDPARGRLGQEHDYDRYVQQLIRQVLLTAQGERINRPDFGGGVRRLVFIPNSSATASLAQTLIFQALNTWLGNLIRTDDIQVESDNERLNISVVYTVLARGERRFLNLEVTL